MVTIFLAQVCFHACSKEHCLDNDLFRKGEKIDGYGKLASVFLQAETRWPSFPSEERQPGAAPCAPPGLRLLYGTDESFTSTSRILHISLPPVLLVTSFISKLFPSLF